MVARGPASPTHEGVTWVPGGLRRSLYTRKRKDARNHSVTMSDGCFQAATTSSDGDSFRFTPRAPIGCWNQRFCSATASGPAKTPARVWSTSCFYAGSAFDSISAFCSTDSAGPTIRYFDGSFAFARRPASSTSSMTKAWARPDSSSRNDSPWSLA